MGKIIKFNQNIVRSKELTKSVFDSLCEDEEDIDDYKLVISAPNGELFDIIAVFISHEDGAIYLHME